MKESAHKTSESRKCGSEISPLKRFMQELRAWRAKPDRGTSGHRSVLPPEADANVSARRVFLGSTLEFMQREYFSGSQPKKIQRDEN